MPLEKIPAIFLSGIGTYISLTAPTPLKPKNERPFGDRLVESQDLTRTMRAGYCVHTIIELCIIVAGTMNSTSWANKVIAFLLPNGTPPESIKLTPATTFATILIVLGAAIRYWCFREMGRQFTYHVTLLKNHKLVTTGPYSIVRHPSYTGAFLTFAGNAIWYTARGSWLRESMVYTMKLSWFFIIPVMISISLCPALLLRRLPLEDSLLKREFGKEWDEWAKAVPYRLFPGIV